MKETHRIVIRLEEPEQVKSLCWHGEALIDWVGGGKVYALDGQITDNHIRYAYRFDAAIALEDYAIIYERLGTKAHLLKRGKGIRQLNRDWYHAEVYEYPIALLKLPDGRIAVAHCPDNYCKIEIEEAETGLSLTQRDNKPMDFFHSRLRVSPNNRYLLSAGWYWHPLDGVEVFDIAEVLQHPENLDKCWWDSAPHSDWSGEVHTAAFARDGRLFFTGYPDLDAQEQPKTLGCYDPTTQEILFRTEVEETVGEMLPLGDVIIGFFEYPKMFDVHTGRVLARWPELPTGPQNSSIIHHHAPPPVLALDLAHQRFALAGNEGITVIQFG